MKKFLLTALILFTAMPTMAQTNTVSADGRLITAPVTEEHLQDDKIYFFAHSMCMPCRDAFIYLETYHKDLNIPITDMKFHHNFELYKECVKKFNIDNDELTLPLICMGNNYIMGWQKTDSLVFDKYLTQMPQKKN